MKLYVKRKPFINFRQESVGADEPMDEGLPDADTDPVGRAAEIARRQEAAVARHAAEAKLQDDEDDKAPTKGQKGKKNIKGRARLGNSTGSTSATSPGTSQTASPTRSLSQTSSSSASPTSTTTTSPTISSSPISSPPATPTTTATTFVFGSFGTPATTSGQPSTSGTTTASPLTASTQAFFDAAAAQLGAPKRHTRSSGLNLPPVQVYLLPPPSRPASASSRSSTPRLVIDMTMETNEQVPWIFFSKS